MKNQDNLKEKDIQKTYAMVAISLGKIASYFSKLSKSHCNGFEYESEVWDAIHGEVLDMGDLIKIMEPYLKGAMKKVVAKEKKYGVFCKMETNNKPVETSKQK